MRPYLLLAVIGIRNFFRRFYLIWKFDQAHLKVLHAWRYIHGYCEDMLETVTTCADKERVLEHSESGKYWCRRVQP